MVGWIWLPIVARVLGMVNLCGCSTFTIRVGKGDCLSFPKALLAQSRAVLVSPFIWFWTAFNIKCLKCSSELFLKSFGWSTSSKQGGQASLFRPRVSILWKALTLWDSKLCGLTPWLSVPTSSFLRSCMLSPCPSFLFWVSKGGSVLVLLRPSGEWLVKDSCSL